MKKLVKYLIDELFNKFSSNQIITIISLMMLGGTLIVMFKIVVDKV
jgi:hypothetical protein